ncbi:MAG: DUF2207 family protein [Bacillota bacterium]
MNRLLISLIIGIILGILIVIYDISGSIHDKKVKNLSSININNFSLLQLGSVLYKNKVTRKKAILAEIFHMAKQGKIKFISKLEEGITGIKSSPVKTEIISEEELSQEQKVIVNGLKEKKFLKDFFKDKRIYNQINKRIDKNLKENDLLSLANIQIRKRIVIFSIIFFFVPAIIFGSYAIMRSRPIFFGLTVLLLISGTGRLIKIVTIPVLSKKGLKLKQKTNIYLDKKVQRLKRKTKKEPEVAVKDFFEELPLLILHNKFNKILIKKIKKRFEKVKRVNIPEWLELDDSSLNKSIKAGDILEVVEFIVTSTLLMATTAGVLGSSKNGEK